MPEGVTLLVGTYADVHDAQKKLGDIPSEIRAVPNSYKDLALVVDDLFEMEARKRLNLIKEEANEKLH